MNVVEAVHAAQALNLNQRRTELERARQVLEDLLAGIEGKLAGNGPGTVDQGAAKATDRPAAVSFRVFDKATEKPIEADDYASLYWGEQVAQRKEHPKENQLPYLFFKKCSWLLDEDGTLSIGDSCGNFVHMDYQRYEVRMSSWPPSTFSLDATQKQGD